MSKKPMPAPPAWIENWCALNNCYIRTSPAARVWEIYPVEYFASAVIGRWRPMLQCRPNYTLEIWLEKTKGYES